MVAALGAGGVLAAVLSATGPAALAQPASAQTLLSDHATPSGGQQFDTPIAVRYNACEKAFYVLQTGFTPASPAGRVLKVDAATGARTLFASYLGAENYALLLRPIPVPLPRRQGPSWGIHASTRDTPGSGRASILISFMR